MSNLVSCKSCKKDVDKTAKTCPHCGVKSPGTTSTDTAKGCLGFIVLAIVFAFFLNSCGEDKKKTTSTDEAAPTQLNNPIIKVDQDTPDFHLSIEQFLNRYNQSLLNLGLSSYASIVNENDNGELLTLTVASSSEHIGLVLSANNISRALQSIILIGSGDGTTQSGIEISFSALALVMAIEDPNMAKQQRAQAIKDLGLLSDTIFNGKKITKTRNEVYYTLSHSEYTGLLFTADPKPQTKPTPRKEQGNIPILTDENINDFVVDLSNDYLTNLGHIVRNYKDHKANNDPHGYITWLKSEWSPQYDIKQKKYNDILDNNRHYLFDKDEFKLLVAFSDLSLISQKLMTSLRDNNQSDADFAVKKVSEDAPLFDEIIKSRQLESKINTFDDLN